MFGAIANIPASHLREMRVEELAKKLIVSFAANPTAMELRGDDIVLMAFKLAEAFDDHAQGRRK
ncbi:hypothetical protein LMG28727_04874 [Paraburkholderia kirstenboschensis]|nr:hypothetical protein LMG28727_04874 [Paraburkholderia kirstenboschensis]